MSLISTSNKNFKKLGEIGLILRAQFSWIGHFMSLIIFMSVHDHAHYALYCHAYFIGFTFYTQ